MRAASDGLLPCLARQTKKPSPNLSLNCFASRASISGSGLYSLYLCVLGQTPQYMKKGGYCGVAFPHALTDAIRRRDMCRDGFGRIVHDGHLNRAASIAFRRLQNINQSSLVLKAADRVRKYPRICQTEQAHLVGDTLCVVVDAPEDPALAAGFLQQLRRRKKGQHFCVLRFRGGLAFLLNKVRTRVW